MEHLDARMPNEATVSDWLGTAQTAAESSAVLLDRVRTSAPRYGYGVRMGDHVGALDKAEKCLEQALNEVRAVKSHLAYLNAYSK